MKVLWFSNTPSNACDFLKEDTVGGGWIKSLDKALQSKVDLHVAFYYPKMTTPFKYLNTTYYPIGSKSWKLAALTGFIYKRKFVDRKDQAKYLDIINSVNPDIIHIHGTENPFGFITSITNIPVITSIQGCITVYYHKFFSGFDKKSLHENRIDLSKSFKQNLFKKSFLSNYKEMKRMMERERSNMQGMKLIIGRTEWDRRIASILAPQCKYFIGNEMLRDGFYSKTWESVKSDKLILHTTTSNNPYKGFETICQALIELTKSHHIPIEWRISGLYSNDSIVKVVKKKLGRQFPAKQLVFLGKLREKELIEKMLEAQIFVFTSHIENSSNSICEAMLLGMPCIATYTGGTVSLLENGKEGILIQDGDPWSLAGAILELFNNPGRTAQYGQNARQRALIRHDKEGIVNELLSIYQDIISNNSK